MSKYQLTDSEESRELLKANVKRINDRNYQVKFVTRRIIFKIYSTIIGWVCSCAVHIFRGLKCKHIYAVEFSLELCTIFEVRMIEALTISGCKYCKYENLTKDGLRHNKHGDIQKLKS